MRRAVLILSCAGVAGVTGVTVVVAARASVARIRRRPDPVPLGRLRREPSGADLVVTQPDGTRLRVLAAGPRGGPTVVLAHGLASDLGEWNLVWDDLLSRGYRTIAFDQRGHGRSTIGSDGISAPVMAADLLAVLEATEATDAILVGHSMGGFLALWAVLEVPGVAQRLTGLVLAATFAGDILDGAPLNRIEAPILRRNLVPRLARHPTAGTLFAASYFGPEPSPAMLQAFLDMILARDHGALLPVLEDFTRDDLCGRLAEVDLPTTVLCGRADHSTPARASRRLVEGIPGARLVWVDGAGHMLPWESPRAIVDAVAATRTERGAIRGAIGLAAAGRRCAP